ncbi:cytochrome P450 [Panus rudis PR-1116 ss-1]|nr:cytochrome P450 [Panus rudis PR-1116 ss-1]WJQ78190.1 cytochrome P450 monooxygenase [Panus rudis]
MAVLDAPTATLLIFAVTVVGYYLHNAFSKKRNYPPGPKGWPIIGNALDVPAEKTWRYFEKLSHEYGPIVRLSMGGEEIIVLSDPKDCEELLGRRSHNYSSRRPLIYAGKYQSGNKRMLLLRYGPVLKRQRAAFHQMLQPRVVGGYEAIQHAESAKLLNDMLVRPQDIVRNCKRFAASLVFNLSYGRRLGDDDKDLQAVEDILENFIRNTYPGSHLVDSFPILDLLPDFLSPWRKEARKRHEVELALYKRLADDVKYRMENGNEAVECFTARLWEQKDKIGIDLYDLYYTSGTAFEAGTDTMAASLLWFLQAMVLYPHTQAKAQAELDRVLGADGETIPTLKHLDDLPYCVALVKEIFRWEPAAPGGFPHYSDADDEYKGYFIRANSTIVPCTWNMHHDEKVYPNSYTFDPERFYDPNKPAGTEHDPLTEGHYSFGFGRRKCPGLHLGSRTVWIGIVRLLWAFNFTSDYDEQGRLVGVDPEKCTSGMTSKPEEFPLHITPRSANHVKTIKREWEAQQAGSA